MSYDTKENPAGFATKGDLHCGDVIKVDEGFDCMSQHKRYQVQADDKGDLYVVCNSPEHGQGKHYLNGQIDDENGVYIGVWKDTLAQAV